LFFQTQKPSFQTWRSLSKAGNSPSRLRNPISRLGNCSSRLRNPVSRLGGPLPDVEIRFLRLEIVLLEAEIAHHSGNARLVDVAALL
jgi:hypothetical protein